jgi:hypothetical protein
VPTESPKVAELRQRIDALAQRAKQLEADGLPGFPIRQVQEAAAQALTSGSPEQAAQVVKRGEALFTKVSQDWTWVKELLRRADELRAIAATIGVDLDILDARVGNPRKRLLSEPISSGSLDKAAASASLALAVLNDAVPKFCVQEAQKLGLTIRQARDRGEEVKEAAASFSRLLQAVQDQNLPTSAQRLVETRKAVGRIPRAPPMTRMSSDEEEEILLEARNLARRLQRIKGKARDATSAARLMSQVRQALAEDRRYGTPEEEIEELWLEVDRITREHRRAAEAPPVAVRERDERRPSEVVPTAASMDDLDVRKPKPLTTPSTTPPPTTAAPAPAAAPAKPSAAPAPSSPPTPPEGETKAPEGSDEEEKELYPHTPRGFLVPYVPPEMPMTSGPNDTPAPGNRPRLRPRVPP